MLPPAPGLLSTMTGWCVLSETFCPSRRATESSGPPAGYGTTKRIGFDGYGCACVSRVGMQKIMNHRDHRDHRGKLLCLSEGMLVEANPVTSLSLWSLWFKMFDHPRARDTAASRRST